jgi:hypothetical protein
MENIFEWLQSWYKSQCNGDWEHEYGIKIETVDNPGWYVVIDLIGTECEGCLFSPVQADIDESNWFFCKLSNDIFEASCDTCNLTKVLLIFREWVENCQKENIP